MSTEEQLQDVLSHERRLVRGLLLWGILLSLTQAATLTLLFTWQKSMKGPSEENARVTVQPPMLPALFQEYKVDHSGRASNKSIDTISWRTEDSKGPVNISSDGCYFLYVQVTMQKTDVKPQYLVQVNKHNGQSSTVLLEHNLASSTLNVPSSTGFLGRQVRLIAGDTLSVTCSPAALINTSSTATYFGFYLLSV